MNNFSLLTDRFEDGFNTTAPHTSAAPVLLVYRWTWSIVVKIVILWPIIIAGAFGNGMVLAAIKNTPILQTKTNKILASMNIAEISLILGNLVYTTYALVAYVFESPCRYAVLDTVFQGIPKILPKISMYHLVAVGIDRYVAIVHPLVYDERLTDRVVHWMLFGAWFSGITVAMSYSVWAVTADSSKCTLVPAFVPAQFNYANVATQFYLISVFLIVVYGRILRIAWRQHVAIHAANVSIVPLSSVVNGGSTTSTGQWQENEEHRQAARKRRYEFKAVYLTAAIVGTFITLWTPYQIGNAMLVAGVSKATASSLIDIGGPLGVSNCCVDWVMYAAVSKSFQRAFKKIIGR